MSMLNSKRFGSDESGSIAVPFALMLVILIGAIGLSIDFSRSVDEQSKLQEALDSAVLAGAAVTDDQVSRADAVFHANMKSALATNATATFTLGDDGLVSGKANVNLSAPFAKLYGVGTIAIHLTAAAKPSATASSPCVLLLDPSANQSLLVNSGANVSADCEFHVKSTANPAAIFNSGTTLDTKKICIQGSKIIDNGGSHPNTALQCETINDPFANKLPTPSSSSCNYNNLNYNGGSATLSPGVYCGWINLNNKVKVTFNPGVYVIKGGGWNVNGGTWTGTGVTFYFADNSVIQFNSGVSANVSAPTSGDYDGIIMFEKPGLSKSNFVFDDSAGFNLQGLFYLPSRNVTFNSGSGVTNRKAGMVFNTLILNGTKWNLSPGGREFPSAGGSGAPVLVN